MLFLWAGRFLSLRRHTLITRMWLSETLLTAGGYGPVTVLRILELNSLLVASASFVAILSALSSKMSFTVSSMIREYGGKPKSCLS